MDSRMTFTGLPDSAVELLRCQQTLESLQPSDGGLESVAADVLYPVHDGIVFMGGDARAQGTTAGDRPDPEEIRRSAPGLVDVINLIERLGAAGGGRRLVDVGSGVGWASRLFAEAGYDPWMVDCDPNALWLGDLRGHPALGPGKRIVADATLMPFADATFDVALVQELAHHVESKDRLLAEVNRVLRPGGLCVLIEPTHGLSLAWPESLRRALARNGLRTFWRGRRFPSVRAGSRFTRDPFGWLQEHVPAGDGSMVALARKDVAVRRRREVRIRVVDPGALVVTEADRAALAPLRSVLDDAARGLAAVTAPA
jgi:SAM-dependent methyltransferase